MTEPTTLPAAEAAWLLLEVLRGSESALRAGYCIGELRACDLTWTGSRIVRRRPRRIDRLRHRFAMRRHARDGHDPACFGIGIPVCTARHLLRSWCGADSAEFLLDAMEHGIEELEVGEWSELGPRDVLTHVIGRRISVRAPADHVCVEVFGPRGFRLRGSLRNRRPRGAASPG